MGFWSKLFGRTKTETREINPLTDPIDNPFDARKDGSIRPGDPMWDIMMRSMHTGRAMHGSQRDDGTWDVKEQDGGDWKSL
jgi:hypothetical protein